MGSAAGLATLPSALSGRPARDSSFDPWVEIHPGQLRHNVSEVSRRVEGRPILAVIKNNGYGLGLVNVARILEPLPAIEGFAVVKLQEAISLREAGIRKPVLLMGPFDDAGLEELAVREIALMVYQPLGKSFETVSSKLEQKLAVHICVDTGIGRVGVPHSEAWPLINAIARRESVRLDGIMMTFTEDSEFDKEQLSRFRALTDRLEAQGLRLGRKHAASTYALFQHPESFLDMVRPGMALYGIYPTEEFQRSRAMDLRPAVSLKARVVYVKQIRKGESAGYDRVYRATQDIWLATIPAGHADGLPRTVVKGARVRIGSKLYPMVAISASHCIVELGQESSVRAGDVATFFDGRDGSRPEDFARASGASVYDLTMHLNPLLPRKIVHAS